MKKFNFYDKPIAPKKNRLAKSTRYCRNALKYYQNALNVLSNNETLANSFDTFINEERKLNNRGYSINTSNPGPIEPSSFQNESIQDNSKIIMSGINY